MKNEFLFLVSEALGSATTLEKLLCGGLYQVHYGDESQLFQVDKVPRVIAYDTNTMTEGDLETLTRISAAFEGTQILVFTHELSISAYQDLTKLSNVVTLRKDTTPDQVRILLAKLIQNQTLESAPLTRFPSDQPVKAVVMRTGLYVPTRMKNYSASGAFLEYKGISIRVGDLLQIGLIYEGHSPHPKDQKQLRARVVWVRDEVSPTPIRGVGVEFIDQ